MGSLMLPQPLTWPCIGDTFSLTLWIRNAELGAGGAVVGTPREWGAAPRVRVQAPVRPELLACPANPVLPQSQFLLLKCQNNGFPGCPKTKPFLKQPKPPPPLCSFSLLFRFVQGRQALRVDKLRCHPTWGHHAWGPSRAPGSQCWGSSGGSWGQGQSRVRPSHCLLGLFMGVMNYSGTDVCAPDKPLCSLQELRPLPEPFSIHATANYWVDWLEGLFGCFGVVGWCGFVLVLFFFIFLN